MVPSCHQEGDQMVYCLQSYDESTLLFGVESARWRSDTEGFQSTFNLNIRRSRKRPERGHEQSNAAPNVPSWIGRGVFRSGLIRIEDPECSGSL